jgi:hypothetical protein
MPEVQVEVERWCEEVDSIDIPSSSVEELKRLRDAGRELETIVSYARRVLQVRLDLAAEPSVLAPERVAEVVAPEASSSEMPSRLAAVELTEASVEAAEEYVRSLVGGDRSHTLDLLDDQQLASYRSRLREAERSVSVQRKGLHDRLDRLASELVRRYHAPTVG